MKPTSNLITNVRRLFAFGRALTVLCLISVPIILFVPSIQSGADLGEVYFKSRTSVAQNTADGTSRTVEIENQRGYLTLQLVTPAERTLHRAVCAGTFGPGLVLAFLLCHWMWRLCRNVENGEIFSAGNLQLVRRLGWLLIAEALVSFAVQVWAARYVAAYITENLSVPGLEVTAPNSDDLLSGIAPLAISQLIYGLLVLCLTEVFRQGVKLKQEADLTV